MYKVRYPQKQFKHYDPTKFPILNLRNSEQEYTKLLATIAPKSSDPREKRLQNFYLWVDAVMAEISSACVCERGCAHCCKQLVSVTPLEIELAKLSPKFGKASPFDPATSYCPFLDRDTAQCSIYEFRPLACRAFLAFDDPKYCEANVEHCVTTIDQLCKKLPDLLPSQSVLRKQLIEKIDELFLGERTDFRVCNCA